MLFRGLSDWTLSHVGKVFEAGFRSPLKGPFFTEIRKPLSIGPLIRLSFSTIWKDKHIMESVFSSDDGREDVIPFVTPSPATDAGTSVGEQSAELIEVILNAADCLRSLLAPQLSMHGLNDARFALMRTIQESPRNECSQTELAEHLKQSEANISTLLERMRIDGLITREKSPLDRRKSVVRLTARGELLLAQSATDYLSRGQSLLGGMEAVELFEITSSLQRLLSAWEKELELQEKNPAVAGRIGRFLNPLDPPQAQAG